MHNHKNSADEDALTMYDIEHSIGFLLSKAYQRAWAILREEIEPYDLTPPQFCLLAFLWQQDGLTQAELAEKGQIDRSTIGGMVDRLVKLSLVERRPHPQDRRAHMIHLTGQGKELEQPLSDCAQRARARITSCLNGQEANELTRMLELMRADRRFYEVPTC
ncbi:MarR family winged helix-turn-helix transcriptional regulator [Pelobacter propionicus]|uniref:Transcriptional regulator, MarR family n=1 Tax=Pelobacter propionicus (strain DSM 2379 / NBRC 103807 / OttBd1) TaxID=338966 RepID=A1ASB6_PELPD|nr:MarR family transcriptional regulator [Pelobacter propionicus]ABL00237.1 transcriptional regulator, MarR family [Pelobacter propionicus DSM 2379]